HSPPSQGTLWTTVQLRQGHALRPALAGASGSRGQAAHRQMADALEFPDPPPPGYRLHERYLIEAELPTQAMGRTYPAADVQLKEVVAVSVLDVALRGREGVSRFRARFKAAFYRHRGKVFEYGECLGVPYAEVKYDEDPGAIIDVGQA